MSRTVINLSCMFTAARGHVELPLCSDVQIETKVTFTDECFAAITCPII